MIVICLAEPGVDQGLHSCLQRPAPGSWHVRWWFGLKKTLRGRICSLYPPHGHP